MPLALLLLNLQCLTMPILTKPTLIVVPSNTPFGKANDAKPGLPALRSSTRALTKKSAKSTIAPVQLPKSLVSSSPTSSILEKFKQKSRARLARARLLTHKKRVFMRDLRRYHRLLFARSATVLADSNPASTTFVHAVENTKRRTGIYFLKSSKNLILPVTRMTKEYPAVSFSDYHERRLGLGQFQRYVKVPYRDRSYRARRARARRLQVRRCLLGRGVCSSLLPIYNKNPLGSLTLYPAATFNLYNLNRRFYSSITTKNEHNISSADSALSDSLPSSVEKASPASAQKPQQLQQPAKSSR